MKAVILLSTGIDSPVAASLLKDSGIDMVAVSCITGSHDEKKEKAIIEICRKTGIKKAYLPDINPIQKEFLKRCSREYQCILCKRAMYRVAEAIARKEGADIIATGENLGQVASQTIKNMAVISSSVKMKTVRPLLCIDKNETTEIAKSIGTYEISNQHNYSCPYLPKSPATKSNAESIEREEGKIEVYGQIIERCSSEAKTITIK